MFYTSIILTQPSKGTMKAISKAVFEGPIIQGDPGLQSPNSPHCRTVGPRPLQSFITYCLKRILILNFVQILFILHTIRPSKTAWRNFSWFPKSLKSQHSSPTFLLPWEPLFASLYTTFSTKGLCLWNFYTNFIRHFESYLQNSIPSETLFKPSEYALPHCHNISIPPILFLQKF